MIGTKDVAHPMYCTGATMFLKLRPLALLGLAAATSSLTAAPAWKDAEGVLKAKCYECHNAKKSKGDVNLEQFAADPKLAEQFEIWVKVKETIENGDMPPPKAHQMSDAEHAALLGWVTGGLEMLAESKSGDPGPVTMRRLSNAEYDYTIRDLTGHDYGLAREFQTDGGGGEGFTNTGDVLFLSPAAIDKYFSAARKLAEHATIMPGTGIVFHPQRIGLRGPEQVKAQAQQALYVWLQQKAAPHLPKDDQPLREGDYMFACWKHRNQAVPLEQLAQEMKLNIHFLRNWWKHLNNTEPKSRFLDLTRVPWRELPADEKIALERIKVIEADRQSWNNPKRPGEGPQRWQQDSDGIRPYPMQASVAGKTQAHLCFGDTADGNKGDIALVTSIEVTIGKEKRNYCDWLNKTLEAKRQEAAANPPPPNLDALKARVAELEKMRAAYGKHPQPGRQIEPHVLAFAAPCIFTMPLPEGAQWLKVDTRLDMQNPEVDDATIQWTISTDAPRDPTKVMSGVLTIWKRGTTASYRTMAEFDAMKQAFPDMFERRLEEVADNLHRRSPGLGVYYFADEQLGELLSQRDRDQLAAMKNDWIYVAPGKLNAQQEKEYDGALLWRLKQFAKRAWRRPITPEETQKLDALYFASRGKELDRESAAREVLVRVLVSPNFLFKAETLPLTSAPGEDVPLSAHELASRLSYFLWASLPDSELCKAADDGSITKPEVLTAHTLRMLRDWRAAALAREFAGQWLKFAGFDAQSSVDEKKFPEFTPELRADMQREITEFFRHLVRDDRNVADVITGDYSFLNERLAKFYGVPGVTGGEFREVKVAPQNRGGVLGMGAILTKTSRPNRTSPVLRGDYLYQVVLGFSSPPPPPNVPELKETSKPASLREALRQHREDQSCSVCHDRIDPLGFALESFDPIGRFRTADEDGGKIDDTGELKDGTKFQGLAGLRDYLKKNESNFTAQFNRKLLGYALGRQTMPSDKKLLAQMQESLKKNGGKVSAAVLDIVRSRQFLNRRNEATLATNN
jgi:mono/diheme cytochrome c family protein